MMGFKSLVVYLLCLQVGMSALEEQSIQVIGAGLGRTGTFTLRAALEILGYKPYHYVDLHHAKQWADHAEGRLSTDEIIDLVVNSGYNATVDNPTCDLYAQFLERFPEAKVILTVRNTPKKFEDSWKILLDTMHVTERRFSPSFPSFFQWIPLFRYLKVVRCGMGKHLGLEPCHLTHGWRNEPEGWLAKQYEKHNAQVMQTVPSNQLLVYNVKQGWKPLCSFLGVDLPDVPFPNASVGMNDAVSLKRMKRIFLIVIYGWIPTVVLLLVGIWRCTRKARRKKTKTN